MQPFLVEPEEAACAFELIEKIGRDDPSTRFARSGLAGFDPPPRAHRDHARYGEASPKLLASITEREAEAGPASAKAPAGKPATP